jgi:hypothetical protein
MSLGRVVVKAWVGIWVWEVVRVWEEVEVDVVWGVAWA